MPIHFTTRDQDYHLEVAAIFTSSGGWRSDAQTVAAYDDAGDKRMRGVMVFQNHDAFGADVHFALAPGRRNTRRLFESLLKFSFHPTMKNLPAIRAFIPAENVEMQLAAIHMGFTIEARIAAGVLSSSDVVLMVLKRENSRWSLPVQSGPMMQES